jgi:hypothetical protein
MVDLDPAVRETTLGLVEHLLRPVDEHELDAGIALGDARAEQSCPGAEVEHTPHRPVGAQPHKLHGRANSSKHGISRRRGPS